MSYTKLNLVNGVDKWTAEHVDHLEQGILANEKELESKQPKGEYLTEHQKIKTINGQSLVGEGNLEIQGSEGASAECMCIKNAVFFGDSITHGVYSFYDTDGSRKNGFDTTDDGHPRIPAYFGQLAGANVTNHGKRGSGWVQDTRKLGNGLAMTQQTDFAEYDFAAYCLGINDYLQSVPLGTFSGGTTEEPIETEWVQGACSSENDGTAVFYDNQANRIRSGFLQPPYHIKLKEGYVIRGIVAFEKAEYDDAMKARLIVKTAELKTGITMTEEEVSARMQAEGITYSLPYHMISVCKTDATASISPDEDFIEEFYKPASVAGNAPTQTEGTVVGNMALCFKQIAQQNPLCKVVVYSPYNTWGQVSAGGDYVSDTYYGDESTNYALGRVNSAGYTLQDLIDTIDKVCEFYGIAHVPLSKSNICNRLTIKDIMIDGLHPSRESRPYLAAEIFGKKCFDR